MRKLLGLVVLVALLVGVDRAGAWFAGHAVASRIQQAAHLQTAPRVTVEGFPFVTQVLQGRYQRVDVDAAGPLAVGDLGLDHLTGSALGARVPLTEVVNGSVSSIPVDRAEAAAHISWPELDRLVNDRLGAGAARLHFSSGGAGRVAVRTVVDTPVGVVTLRGRAGVSVHDGRLRVTISPQDLQGAPDVVRNVLANALDRSFPLPRLAMGFTVTSASPDSSGLRLGVAAQHTTLALP